MSGPLSEDTGLAAHDVALSGLFESLLAEGPAGDEIPADPAGGGSAETITGATPPTEPPLNDPGRQPLNTEASVESEAEAPLPVWAKGSFRALLFRIGAFRFAMPLVLMRSIFLLPDRVTRVPAQPHWHRGLVRYRGEPVVIADFGLLLGLQASCEVPRYLLLIGDGHAALECDEIEDAVVVDPKAVRWSRNGATRAWLAGLMPHQMCGLLDADAISEEFRHG